MLQRERYSFVLFLPSNNPQSNLRKSNVANYCNNRNKMLREHRGQNCTCCLLCLEGFPLKHLYDSHPYFCSPLVNVMLSERPSLTTLFERGNPPLTWHLPMSLFCFIFLHSIYHLLEGKCTLICEVEDWANDPCSRLNGDLEKTCPGPKPPEPVNFLFWKNGLCRCT